MHLCDCHFVSIIWYFCSEMGKGELVDGELKHFDLVDYYLRFEQVGLVVLLVLPRLHPFIRNEMQILSKPKHAIEAGQFRFYLSYLHIL